MFVYHMKNSVNSTEAKFEAKTKKLNLHPTPEQFKKILEEELNVDELTRFLIQKELVLSNI